MKEKGPGTRGLLFSGETETLCLFVSIHIWVGSQTAIQAF